MDTLRSARALTPADLLDFDAEDRDRLAWRAVGDRLGQTDMAAVFAQQLAATWESLDTVLSGDRRDRNEAIHLLNGRIRALETAVLTTPAHSLAGAAAQVALAIHRATLANTADLSADYRRQALAEVIAALYSALTLMVARGELDQRALALATYAPRERHPMQQW